MTPVTMTTVTVTTVTVTTVETTARQTMQRQRDRRSSCITSVLFLIRRELHNLQTVAIASNKPSVARLHKLSNGTMTGIWSHGNPITMPTCRVIVSGICSGDIISEVIVIVVIVVHISGE
eukprot:scpid55530/ scgid1707/ 